MHHSSLGLDRKKQSVLPNAHGQASLGILKSILLMELDLQRNLSLIKVVDPCIMLEQMCLTLRIGMNICYRLLLLFGHNTLKTNHL